MMAFIEQEAKEKVEEIDAKVNEKEIVNVCFTGLHTIGYPTQSNPPARCSQIRNYSDVTRVSGD